VKTFLIYSLDLPVDVIITIPYSPRLLQPKGMKNDEWMDGWKWHVVWWSRNVVDRNFGYLVYSCSDQILDEIIPTILWCIHWGNFTRCKMMG
jgi:hypothetical protein